MPTLYEDKDLWDRLRMFEEKYFEEKYRMESADFSRRWESGEFREGPDFAEWAALCARLGTPGD